MEATGLKPMMDEEHIEKLRSKDKYANAQPKIFS